MTGVAWREDDFEEQDFDPRMFASGGANTSIIEKESFWNLGVKDLVRCVVEGTARSARKDNYKYNYLVAWLVCMSAPWANPDKVISVKLHESPFLAHTPIVLSRSLIAEPSHQAEANPVVSSWEDDEQQNNAAVHPLTVPIYKRLAEVPVPIRQAIEDILQKLASSVPTALTRNLPSLRLASLEDASYLLEWIFEDRRLGFSFETNPKESGWYYVFSNGSSEHYESGTMDQLEVNRLVRMTLHH